MKSLKFINIFCLIVLAISLVTIGAFVAMNQWVEVISNGLFILILAAMMLRWQSILRKEKELDEREKRLDGLSERVLPIAVGAALFAGLHLGKDDKDSPEPEKKEPDHGQPLRNLLIAISQLSEIPKTPTGLAHRRTMMTGAT